jgi:hypothetical protein
MSEIILNEPYQPTDPETGELLPAIRTFVVEGLGYGIAEVFQGGYSTPEPVRVTLVKPSGGSVETEEAVWLDDENTSLQVVCNDELLIAAMKTRLNL